jgi:polysaccharide deacetylase family protein (PEP-CTERM system associated)
MNPDKAILLTIDVEDWFQVENFRPWIPFETWDQCELRVERNVHKLLNLFDSITSAGRLEARGQEANILEIYQARKPEGSEDSELSSLPACQPASLTQKSELRGDGQLTTDNGQTKKVRATFFVLGWIAERLPHLVREIHSRGHEIASHSYNHNLCNQQSHVDLKRELTESKKLMEDITGSPIFGFRAPNFSINDDILKIIQDCGYRYDSSYNSFGLHGRYGKISFNGHRKIGIALQIFDNFFELPISNLKLRDRTVPLGGGGYFRLIPYSLFRRGLQSILKKDGAYLHYMHPWEIDSEQPKVKKASLSSKLRHYTNLKSAKIKLVKLIDDFSICKFMTCMKYINETKNLSCNHHIPYPSNL